MIETISTWLESILPGITTLSITNIPVLIFLVLFSIVFCTLGYRLFRILVGIWGAGLGAFLGLYVASLFTDIWWVWLIAAVVGAALICVAVVLLDYVSTFLTIGVPVAILTAGMLNIWLPQLTTLYICIIAVVAGVIFGLLAAFFKKPVIIICSAICGAFGCISAFWQLAVSLFGASDETLNAFGPNTTGIVLYAAIGTLALVGIIVQFVTTRGFNRDAR